MIDTIFPLRECELLSGLNDAELSSIAIICTTTSMAEGDTLFLEGQKAELIYIVTDGRIALQKSLGDSRKKGPARGGNYRFLLSRRGGGMVGVGRTLPIHAVRDRVGADAVAVHQGIAVEKSDGAKPGCGIPNHAISVRSYGAATSASCARLDGGEREYRNRANAIELKYRMEEASPGGAL